MHVVRNWLIRGVVVIVLTMVPADSRAQNMPDSVDLDSLVQLYEKVRFDHAKHIGLSKDCGVCHHHTTGMPTEDANCIRCHKNSAATAVVACKACHSAQPFSAETIKKNKSNIKNYHKDAPGLKGAYHQGCGGCHARDGGPTGCQDCHPRKKSGDAFYHAGEYAPKTPKNGKSGGR